MGERRRLHLPRRRPHTGVAVLHGELGEARHAAPEQRQRGVVGQEQFDNLFQIMRPWHGDAEFYRAKIVTARFFADHHLPQTAALGHAIVTAGETVLAMSDSQF